MKIKYIQKIQLSAGLFNFSFIFKICRRRPEAVKNLSAFRQQLSQVKNKYECTSIDLIIDA